MMAVQVKYETSALRPRIEPRYQLPPDLHTLCKNECESILREIRMGTADASRIPGHHLYHSNKSCYDLSTLHMELYSRLPRINDIISACVAIRHRFEADKGRSQGSIIAALGSRPCVARTPSQDAQWITWVILRPTMLALGFSLDDCPKFTDDIVSYLIPYGRPVILSPFHTGSTGDWNAFRELHQGIIGSRTRQELEDEDLDLRRRAFEFRIINIQLSYVSNYCTEAISRSRTFNGCSRFKALNKLYTGSLSTSFQSIPLIYAAYVRTHCVDVDKLHPLFVRYIDASRHGYELFIGTTLFVPRCTFDAEFTTADYHITMKAVPPPRARRKAMVPRVILAPETLADVDTEATQTRAVMDDAFVRSAKKHRIASAEDDAQVAAALQTLSGSNKI
jgi:hypothetical protein